LKALAEHPPMTDVFSWQHLQYTVPISKGEHRRLLDDVSGFVAPGKLTALMGESGAGKVSNVVLLTPAMILMCVNLIADDSSQCSCTTSHDRSHRG